MRHRQSEICLSEGSPRTMIIIFLVIKYTGNPGESYTIPHLEYPFLHFMQICTGVYLQRLSCRHRSISNICDFNPHTYKVNSYFGYWIQQFTACGLGSADNDTEWDGLSAKCGSTHRVQVHKVEASGWLTSYM